VESSSGGGTRASDRLKGSSAAATTLQILIVVTIGQTTLMDINWPEVLIGGTLFFVLGAIFNTYVQPAVERRRSSTKESKRRAQEIANAQLAAEITLLADNPPLYTAMYRENVIHMASLIFRGATLLLSSAVISALPIFDFGISAVPVIFAILLVLPATRTARRLISVSSGVHHRTRENILGSGTTSEVNDATEDV
jgi:hypothetical protein